MADDPQERAYAGRPREMQNWIEGSDHSPRNATYVPPPPRTVDDYMDDLLAFANRTDIGVLAQAAIAHAQFESIHPFTDGNGRIGRALINTILRKRGATRRVVVPLASAIVARRESYFAPPSMPTARAMRPGSSRPSPAPRGSPRRSRAPPRTAWPRCPRVACSWPAGPARAAPRRRWSPASSSTNYSSCYFNFHN